MIQFGDICFISNDVSRLRKFYEALFGVEGGGDEFHAFVILDGFAITFDSAEMLQDYSPFGYVGTHCGNNTIIGFDVRDVDAEYEKIVALGAVTLNHPTTHPWGARSFQFRDPDGNILNFRTRL